jgi:hypothetical protein
MERPADNSRHGLLGRWYTLPSGMRVRMRLARAGDVRGIAAVLASRSLETSELDILRLVRFDPRTRTVVCATTPVGGGEAVVGLAAIDHESDEPDMLVVEAQADRCLGALLNDAACARATGLRGRAA